MSWVLARAHWTEREIRHMVDLIDHGLSASEAARVLGRTKDGVLRKMAQIDPAKYRQSERTCARCGKRLARLNPGPECFCCGKVVA
jgi:hypothetical protein